MVEIQLTHGFCLFPSLRALMLVALSGGEFSSGIGDTTGGGHQGRRWDPGLLAAPPFSDLTDSGPVNVSHGGVMMTHSRSSSL